MILHFWDKSTLTITKQQWLQIKDMRDVQKLDWIVLQKPYAEFDPRTIAKVTEGGFTEADIIERDHQLPAKLYTDEDRAMARVKLAEIKKRFEERKKNKLQDKTS